MGKYKVVVLDGTVVWSGESWDHFKVFAANQQKILENICPALEAGTLGDISEEEVETL